MPLRVRLTLWYGTALALMLIVFGGTLYTVLAHGLRNQIDQSLEKATSVAVRAVEQHGIGPFLPFEDLAAEFPELAVLDKTFQIFSPTGCGGCCSSRSRSPGRPRWAGDGFSRTARCGP